MSPLMTDIGKEVVVAALIAGLTGIGSLVKRLVRDMNASFAKVRDLEDRVKELETK